MNLSHDELVAKIALDIHKDHCICQLGACKGAMLSEIRYAEIALATLSQQAQPERTCDTCGKTYADNPAHYGKGEAGNHIWTHAPDSQ